MLDVALALSHSTDMASVTISANSNHAYLSVNEAGQMTGLSSWTWRRWAYIGQIASVKAGRRLLIPRTEIDRVMSEGFRPRLIPSRKHD